MLALTVRQQTLPVLLPNGREYCAELANSQLEMDQCTGNLEDTLYNANRRSERTFETVDKFVRREKLRRNPCGALERIFSARCKQP